MARVSERGYPSKDASISVVLLESCSQKCNIAGLEKYKQHTFGKYIENDDDTLARFLKFVVYESQQRHKNSYFSTIHNSPSKRKINNLASVTS